MGRKSKSLSVPERKAINARLHKAYVDLNELAAQFGIAAMNNPESLRRTMRGFKIANSPLHKRIVEHMEAIVETRNPPRQGPCPRAGGPARRGRGHQARRRAQAPH